MLVAAPEVISSVSRAKLGAEVGGQPMIIVDS